MVVLATLAIIFSVIMSFGYFTQTAKIIKRKSAKDVSLTTYLIFGLGVTVWLIYGISISNFPIILSDTTALVGILSVITSYLIFRKN